MDPLREARKGKEAAFLRLFDEHHLPLFRFAYRLTGSAPDAEDVVQECFLELLRPGCAYDSERTPIRTYLFGVVRNQCLKRCRKNALADDDGPQVTYDRSPESDVLHAEMAEIISRAVHELPETQREVLILAHYEQMPLAEIAGLLKIEVAAVKSRLQRARAQLKEVLAVYAPGAERKS